MNTIKGWEALTGRKADKTVHEHFRRVSEMRQEQRERESMRRDVACRVRKDLLSEFRMSPFASYVQVGEMLCHARGKWLIEPPTTREQAESLMQQEYGNRHRRLHSIK